MPVLRVFAKTLNDAPMYAGIILIIVVVLVFAAYNVAEYMLLRWIANRLRKKKDAPPPDSVVD